MGSALYASGVLHPPYHEGPPGDHFDGRRFFITGVPVGKGLLDVLHWKLTERAARWPDRVGTAASPPPPARVDGGQLRAVWVGHATLLLQTAGLNILTDPIWSQRASPLSFAGPRRVAAPGIAFDALPPIDVVLISHSHYDHMDLPTLQRLQADHQPLFIAPLGNDAVLAPALEGARIATADWWGTVPVSAQLSVQVTPVQHWSRRRAWDRNMALWGGFVISTPAGAVYFAGDTGFGDGWYLRETAARFEDIRLAILPIGAYEPRWFMAPQHMNPDEAVRAHALLGARRSLGMHFGTFQLTDEAIDAPLRALEAARARHQVAADHFLTLPIGGALELPASDGG